MAAVLRIIDRTSNDGRHQVEVVWQGGSTGPRVAVTSFDYQMGNLEAERIRWYLEEYPEFPSDPGPSLAAQAEAWVRQVGTDLFRHVFSDADAMGIWYRAETQLAETRVEVVTEPSAVVDLPWEMLRDPATDGVLALRAGAFVRTSLDTTVPVSMPAPSSISLRMLLVISRPAGRQDAPFRSVASHLVRLSQGAREAFRLDVLRPPTFAELSRVLQAAKAAGEPYQIVHFDGHGAYLDAETAAAGVPVADLRRDVFSLVSRPRPGSHGFLIFEDPGTPGGQQLVDGPALGSILVGAGVSVLVVNACRSAHTDLVTAPEAQDEAMDAHQRVRAYGSLAQEVMDAGVAGVVAMRYNVYVVTAARFIAEVYAGLLAGRPLGAAVTAARRQLAADPKRQIGGPAVTLQDWVVPVVYEAAPLVLLSPSSGERQLSIDLSQAEADQRRAGLEGRLPTGPDVGFYGRDETLLALDRTFDNHHLVLLHAWAGAGKTSTAAEFARWYAQTGGVGTVLFTSFEHHLTLARLLDQVGDQFGPTLEQSGVHWAALDDAQRREVAAQVLAQVPVLWVWDNIEPVAGFPAGTASAWTRAEQDELATFLRDLGRGTRCKVLLTSRREERGWLGDLPARVALPPMPMLERLELARAVARRQTGGAQAFLEVEDWRPLLEFTQGNPLTVTILVRQAIRDHYSSREQIVAFVAKLTAGAATITDDAALGRRASLAAALDYGFTNAFTEYERAILSLLALFQGFADVDVMRLMGNPDLPGGPAPAVAGLDRDTGIALLDRAAEVGLLTAYGGGYYAVHPAIPWHLHALFEQHYGPGNSPTAKQTLRAWTTVVSELGKYYFRTYSEGRWEVISVLVAEEGNLLQARRLALANDWPDRILGPMQGLHALYSLTGRVLEWRRLVNELVSVVTDPNTGGPLPALEEEWSIVADYRVRLARDERDWRAAEQLQQAIVTSERQRHAKDPGPDRTRALSVALEQLGHLRREQEDPASIGLYDEALTLSDQAGDRQGQAAIAFNLGHVYKNLPPVRDLDRAEHWYHRSLELRSDADRLGRARTLGQLGAIAYERFKEARQQHVPEQELMRSLNSAVDGYHSALDLLPPDAVTEQAVALSQLGSIYAAAGDIGEAIKLHQRSVARWERADDRYQAALARRNLALILANAGRLDEARQYATAALRDLEMLGPTAARDAEESRAVLADLAAQIDRLRPAGALR
jgi:tetratricopeptide (TPR) repeat protein